jgi:transcriptional regulator GlxA family with amidase domain
VPITVCREDVPMENVPTQKRIGIVVFDRCQIIDATGPAGVFGAANETLKSAGQKFPLYDVRLLAPTAGRIATSCGVSLFADHALSSRLPPFDTLICAGGKGTKVMCADKKAMQAIAAMAKRTERIVSVCTGAFILAEAGILDGRRAVTHWAYCPQLAEQYPAVTVEADPIYIKDGHVFTSAGVTAGMDLALALVEADLGRDIALTVARDMVMFFKRPGSQAQFSTHLAVQMAPAGSIRKLQMWLLDNLDRDIDVESLVEKTLMSPRTFYRQFKRSTGMTPARFLEQSRLDAARRLIEESPKQIKVIAAECGFGDIERMRRAFQRGLGISPDDYRRRFTTSPNT